MSLKYSTGYKNAVLDTGSFKGTFDGGFIKIYAATSVPASADDANTGGAVLLVTYSDNGGAGGLDLEASATSGVINKNAAQVWKGAAAATGTGLYFRYEQTGDTGASSTTDKRIQGTVGGAGSDLFLASTSFVSATDYNLDMFSIAIPDA